MFSLSYCQNQCELLVTQFDAFKFQPPYRTLQSSCGLMANLCHSSQNSRSNTRLVDLFLIIQMSCIGELILDGNWCISSSLSGNPLIPLCCCTKYFSTLDFSSFSSLNRHQQAQISVATLLTDYWQPIQHVLTFIRF